MKKLLKVLAVAIFAFTPFIISSSALAKSVCEIGYTGPDSQNLCKSTTKYSCEVTNENKVKIKNDNNQVVASGTVSNGDNNQGGNATSGSVTNENGTTFSVTITNPGFEGVCVAEAVVPATEQPETPTTPTTPVTPAPTPVQPTATGAGQVALLPETSDTFSQTLLIVVAASLAVIAGVGVGAVALYRYYKSL